MRETKIGGTSDLNTAQALRSILEDVGLTSNDEARPVSGSARILESVLTALSEGRISEAAEYFDEHFQFNDHALALELTAKLRLTDFFQKTREVFLDTTLDVVSLFEDGNHAIAEWKLTATENVPLSSIGHRVPISLQGSTIITVQDGKVVRWSQYYDQCSSLPIAVRGFFTEWADNNTPQLGF